MLNHWAYRPWSQLEPPINRGTMHRLTWDSAGLCLCPGEVARMPPSSLKIIPVWMITYTITLPINSAEYRKGRGIVAHI